MSKKTYDLINPEDLSVIRSYLQENDECEDLLNEDFVEENVIASEDEVEECDGDSDTEQESEETDDENSAVGTNYFLGKDKITKWSNNPPLRSVRRGPHNIITHLLGVIGNAKSVKTAVDCCNNLFTDKILDNIVKIHQPVYTKHQRSICQRKGRKDHGQRGVDTADKMCTTFNVARNIDGQLSYFSPC